MTESVVLLVVTRILILDDEPVVVNELGKVLELVGYECSCTTDSHKALEILRHEQVDLFIQDIMRPDMDGLTLYGHLKADQSLRFIPVLFFSASVQPEETTALRATYVDGHLRKPATIQEMLGAVAAVLKRSGEHVPTK